MSAAPDDASDRAAAGEVIAELDDGQRVIPAVTRDGDHTHFHFDPWAAHERLTTEAYLPPYRPLYSRLPEFVRQLPGPIRLAGQHVVIPLQQRRYRDPEIPLPRFPQENALEVLRWLVLDAIGDRPPSPWPQGKPVVVLTHDVDTGKGWQVIPRIAREEEQLGLRSCWYVVGGRYPLDHGLLEELSSAGHELGLHGSHHDGKLAFLSADRIARRLDGCMDLAARYRMAGFRSPALLMTPPLVAAVRQRFEYDSSVPDTDVRAVAGPRRGCGSIFPVWRDGLLQLPLTLPLDDRLLLLGHDPAGMLEVWRDKLDWVLDRGGMAVVTTHAEPHLGGDAGVLWAYRGLLEHVLQRDAQVLLAHQADRWWREESLDEQGPQS